MAGPVSRKSEKDKSAGKVQGYVPERDNRAGSFDPYADIMDLQHMAGNQAVSRLLQSGTNIAPPILHEVLLSSGRPLDPITLADMEERFGHDFSQVRVHTDARAARSARSASARAYTIGKDLVFGAGQYAPATTAGKRLLAHELTHVVQQSGSGVWSGPAPGRDSEAEQEACRAADATGPVQVQMRSPIGLARDVSELPLEKSPDGRALESLSDEELVSSFKNIGFWLRRHSVVELAYAVQQDNFKRLGIEILRRIVQRDLRNNLGKPPKIDINAAMEEIERQKKTLVMGEFHGHFYQMTEFEAATFKANIIKSEQMELLRTIASSPAASIASVFYSDPRVINLFANLEGILFAAGGGKNQGRSTNRDLMNLKDLPTTIPVLELPPKAVERPVIREVPVRSTETEAGGGKLDGRTPVPGRSEVSPITVVVEDTPVSRPVGSSSKMPDTPNSSGVAPKATAGSGYHPRPGERTEIKQEWKKRKGAERWAKSVEKAFEGDIVEKASVPRVTGGKSEPRIEGKRVPGKPKPKLDIDKVPVLPGENQRQAVARIRAVIGKKISDHPRLEKLWNDAKAEILKKETLTENNYEELYNRTREAFYRRIRKDPAAKKIFSDAGFSLPEGKQTAPVLSGVGSGIPVEETRISLDHVQEKAQGDNWKKALDADNLRFEFARPNTEREVKQMRHPELR